MQAFVTLSTIGCDALPFVEKDNIATLGSRPTTLAAVAAVALAISANCSAFGSGITAQSANKIRPLSPNLPSAVSIINADETVFIPGAVLITWIAALKTSEVGEFEPATNPSASPSLTIIQPKNLGSVSISFLASSLERFLLFLSSTNSSTYLSRFVHFEGSIIVAPEIFAPYFEASAFIVSSFPIRIIFAVLSFKTISVAFKTLSSSDSGRTIVLKFCLAFSLILSIKPMM